MEGKTKITWQAKSQNNLCQVGRVVVAGMGPGGAGADCIDN